MEKEILLEIRNLYVDVYYKDSKGNKIKQNIYNNFNYKLFKGDKIIFFDNNGAGKTLLFDLIFGGFNNFIKTKGDGIEVQGEILYKGKNILIPDLNERRPFCYITQDDPIRTNSTVLSMIESNCIGNGIDINSEFTQTKINYYLEKFDLQKKKNIKIGDGLFDFIFSKKSNSSLSFGEKKAVNLISKIMTLNNKELILIDEPLNHLSFENSVAFNDCINEFLEKNLEVTIFVISHCRGINFVNKEVCFNSEKTTFIEKVFKNYDCFEKNKKCNKCK